ncbi:hypothetical protein LWI28_007609 [Acer negundo]|uniref:DYW domain-containing protein n=1 Tax=Acer negundo TaxID=4023 RepID=A0AAD5IG89_ACENE|nr:hypothetical protein LWI28_007609 [Acer negundo]
MYRRKPQVLVLVKQLEIRARQNPRIYLTQNVGQRRQVSNYQNNLNHENTEDVGTYQNSSNHYYTGNVGTYQNSLYSGNVGTYQNNSNHPYTENVGTYQNSSDHHYTGNVGTYQNRSHSGNVGTYQNNSNHHYTENVGNVGTYQNSLNHHHTGNVGTYQNSSYSGNFGTYQNSSNHHYTENVGNVGTYQNSSNQQYTGNVGTYQNSSSVYQPNPTSGQYQSANSLGQYQQHFDIHPNSNGIQTSTVASETAKASESSGSIEELDNFVKEGKVKDAVGVLGLLEKQCVPVDLPRFLQLMQACGEAKALEDAKLVHEHIVRSLSPLEVSTYNKIIRMYWECGSANDAFDVFDNMRQHNLTSWDTMITWLAKNGLGEEAVDLFSRFKQAGLKPDGQIFIGVFFACRVLGDTRGGMLHFESMNKDYGIVPSMEHYVSIVDMLGSTGHLDEALEFIEKMPMEPSIDVWEKMMNLCRIHGDLELGDRCAELVEQLDPARLNEQSKAGLLPVDPLDLLVEKEKNKPANKEILTVRNMTSHYRAGDTSHPETNRIYEQIRGLKAHMKEAGYIPDLRFVLHDIDHESREEALLSHSERLALSHGLLNSPPRAPIRIMKNLRVCGDCHNALKIISKIVGRVFVIRDAKRFHQFQDGRCSCNDYW